MSQPPRLVVTLYHRSSITSALPTPSYGVCEMPMGDQPPSNQRGLPDLLPILASNLWEVPSIMSDAPTRMELRRKQVPPPSSLSYIVSQQNLALLPTIEQGYPALRLLFIARRSSPYYPQFLPACQAQIGVPRPLGDLLSGVGPISDSIEGIGDARGDIDEMRADPLEISHVQGERNSIAAGERQALVMDQT